MAVKPGFTFEMHQGVGNTLKGVNDLLNALAVELSKSYPLPLADKCVKVVNILAELRSMLDDKMFSELRPNTTSMSPTYDNRKLCAVYFGKGPSEFERLILEELKRKQA